MQRMQRNRATGCSPLIVVPLLCGMAMTISGCGKTAVQQEDSGKQADSQKTGSAKKPSSGSKSSGDASSKSKTNNTQTQQPPQTADEAVTAVLAGIRNKQPEAVWNFLPAGYQRDVNETMHLFAKKMDPELWNRTMTVSRRVVKLCRDRKTDILNTPAFNTGDDDGGETLSSEWDATLTLAETLLSSDLADLDRMKNFDGGRFLQSTGGTLMEELARFSQLLPGDAFNVELQELAKLEARIVSSEGQTAVVELSLRDAPGETRRVDFVRVEGKWIPKQLAESWPSNIAKLRKQINTELAPDVLTQKKQRMMTLLDRIDESLTELEAAGSAQQFRARFVQSPVAGIVVAFFRSAARTAGTQPSVVPKDIDKNTDKTNSTNSPAGKTIRITVIVRQRLDRSTADMIADKLFTLGKFVDVGVYKIEAESTRFPVSTRQTFNAFRKTITFAEVVSADAEQREIVIRLRRPRR